MALPIPRLATTLIKTVAGAQALSANKPGQRFAIDRLPANSDLPSVVRILTLTQDWLSRLSAAIGSLPMLGGVYVSDIALTANTDFVVTHGISEGTVSWMSLRPRSAFPRFKEVSQTTGKLTLQADATCTVDLLIFLRPQ